MNLGESYYPELNQYIIILFNLVLAILLLVRLKKLKSSYDLVDKMLYISIGALPVALCLGFTLNIGVVFNIYDYILIAYELLLLAILIRWTFLMKKASVE